MGNVYIKKKSNKLRHWDVMTRTFMLGQGHIIVQTQTIINPHLMQHQSSVSFFFYWYILRKLPGCVNM